MHQTSAAVRTRADREYDIDVSIAEPAPAAAKVEDPKAAARRLAVHCASFRGSIPRRAYFQLASTAVPFVLLVPLMFAAYYAGQYWLTLLLAIPGGGLVVRFFIIQHDCGHGSFFASRTVNDWVGRLMSLVTVTPYGLWRREHAQHHATSGNLDKRGVGDISTLTVREYAALSPLGRLVYRTYRHPLFLFGLGVPFYFIILQRSPWGHPYPARDTWKSIIGLNAALAVVYGTIGWFTGYTALLLVAWPMVHVASAAGGWLFFIQHQFEDTHWEQSEDWNFQVAALNGSSFYDLHPVLNWFTGNIGMHHIHHLNSMIPNYRLAECLTTSPELKALNRITLRESFECAKLKLWDEDAKQLVGFDALR